MDFGKSVKIIGVNSQKADPALWLNFVKSKILSTI